MQNTLDSEVPVTISIARCIIPGHEAEYEIWLKGITADAIKFPGHMGVNVLRPTSTSREYVSIFRFDCYDHMKAWQDSDIRNEWLTQLEGISEGEDKVVKGTGLEFWFSLPELPVARPSPHKMVLVLLVVVTCVVTAISFILNPYIADWPILAITVSKVFLQVTLMTYLIMPQVTRLLKPWLFNRSK